MTPHDWEVAGKDGEEVLWRCRRCGYSFWTEGGTLADVFHREDPEISCDQELVRDVMES